MAKIKDIPTADRPREKLLKKGDSALSKSDLLAILLGSGIKGVNVVELSKTIIRKFNKDFLTVSIDDLLTIKGIGKVKALQIYSAIALVKRFYKEKNTDKSIIKNHDNNNIDYATKYHQSELFDLLKEKPVYESKPSYIDLFCGAGGFSYGFSKSGFKNIFSIDIEDSFCKTYKYNFPNHNLIQNNIKNITTAEINKIIQGEDIDIIIGGPPCQGFSIAGNIGRKFIDDSRNYLFKEFVRIVNIVRPKYFVMENVARIYNHNSGKTKDEIILSFENIGYKVKPKILDAADYGVPQIRKRVFFIGSKINNNIVFPCKNTSKFKTIKEAISDLPILKSGEKSKFANHIAMNHSQQMLEKMNYISDGGNRSEIPDNIRPKTGDIRKYIKYKSNKASITVTGDMRKVFHYSQNRALTVRELARLQTFPDDFIFQGSSISKQQQIGNAVPPLMASVIAKFFKEILKNDKKISNIKFNNKFPKINFIGNKDKIASWICSHFPVQAKSVFDAFSGGCSISYEAKKNGYQVISNDILKINYILSKSLIENKHEILTNDDVDIIFSGKPIKGFMYKNYANVLFFPQECKELDLYRKNIEKLTSDYKKNMGLILLRRAMIRKMPYSRFNLNWDKIKQLRNEKYSYEKYKRKRAYHNKSFKYHFLKNLDEYNNAIFDNKKNNKSYNLDVFDALKENSTDIVYLDPPYTGTMNDYFGFYGAFDNYIKSKKLMPFKNNFISKNSSHILFNKLFSSLTNYKYWFLSYNNNSYLNKNDLINIISQYSKNIKIVEKPHIYKVTGKYKKKENKEYLFIIKNENRNKK